MEEMKKYQILYDTSVADDFDVENALLRRLGLQEKYELIKYPSNDPKFLDFAEKADGACIYIPLNSECLDKFPNARVCAIPALGADLAYPEAANEKGIYICNAVAYCNEEVATHSVALILDCVRRTSKFNASLKDGRWNIHEGGKLHRLSQMTHGLVSLGKIAQEVARMMKDGFGVKLKAFDPYAPDEVFEKLGVERADSIEELMVTCDIVSVHTPLFKNTYHMINKKHFDAITKPILFVVTSRGGVVDEDDLLEAIKQGKIEAAGIDVIEDEKNFKSKLIPLKEVTATPHIAYYSEESDIALREINLTDIIEVLEYGRPPKNLINKDVIGHERFKK